MTSNVPISILQENGRKNGTKILDDHGVAYFSRMGKKSAKKRNHPRKFYVALGKRSAEARKVKSEAMKAEGKSFWAQARKKGWETRRKNQEKRKKQKKTVMGAVSSFLTGT